MVEIRQVAATGILAALDSYELRLLQYSRRRARSNLTYAYIEP
jgi:hypothetical protein